MGIVFSDQRRNSSSIEYVRLPDGWEKVQDEDHPGYSYLVDERGRSRARMIADAMWALPRYDCDYFVTPGSTHTSVRVIDREDNSYPFTSTDSSVVKGAHEADEWLKANVPDHRDEFAYWSE